MIFAEHYFCPFLTKSKEQTVRVYLVSANYPIDRRIVFKSSARKNLSLKAEFCFFMVDKEVTLFAVHRKIYFLDKIVGRNGVQR